ncbi:hypothetical protein AB6D89_21180 [Vibrio splendidus]
MKFKLITKMGNEHDIELGDTPRVGDFIGDDKVFKVEFLINTDYIAKIFVE